MASNPFLSFPKFARDLLVLGTGAFLAISISIAAANSYAGWGIVSLAAVILTMVVLLPLILFRGSTYGVFHPIIFFAIWIGLRSLFTGVYPVTQTGIQAHAALFGFSEYELSALYAKYLILEGVSFIFIFWGILTGMKIRLMDKKSKPHIAIAMPHVKVKFLVLSVIPLSAFALLFLHAGSLDALLMQRGVRADQRITAEIGGHYSFLLGAGLFIPMVWAAIDRRCFHSPIFWALVLSSLALVFFVRGSRSHVVLPLIYILSAYMLAHKKFLGKGLVLSIALSVVLIGALGEFRTATQRAQTFDDINFSASLGNSAAATFEDLSRRAGENNAQIAILGLVPHDVPHLYGESFASIPTIFVPRVLWPFEHYPRAGGQLVIERIYGREVGGVPPGRVGEVFWNFSYFGFPVIFFLHGFVLGLTAKYFISRKSSPFATLILLVVLFNFQLTSNGLFNFFHALVPVVLIFYFINTKFIFFEKRGRVMFKESSP